MLYLIIEKLEGHKFIYADVVIIIVVKQLPWGNGEGFLRTSFLKGVLNKANKDKRLTKFNFFLCVILRMVLGQHT